MDFNELVLEYQPKIQRYLSRLVGFNEAEDLTQEVFLKVNKSLERFRGDSNISTWIYKIASNVAIDKFRSSSFRKEEKKKVTLESRADFETLIRKSEKTSGVGNNDIDKKMIKEEMNECIRDFIDELPENYKIPLILSDLENKKNQEIAEILQVSLATVKIRLHRARMKLREKLEAGCVFYKDDDSNLACDKNNNNSC